MVSFLKRSPALHHHPSIMEQELSRIFKKKMNVSSEGLVLTRLQGDASYRIYYRARLVDGSSYIVMKLPAGKSSMSEEMTNLKEKPSEIPFINVAHYLDDLGLPVPKIHFADASAGLLILQDFGDETLEKRLNHSSSVEKKAWYQRAIDLLVQFQTRSGKSHSHCIAHQRSFDRTLLDWEFEHFFEYGIEVRTGIKIPQEDLQNLRKGSSLITDTLLKLPQILVHRDFQSRNIMIQNGDLKLLDFQDALLGPPSYDLVALLRDSYVSLEWDLVSELMDDYLSKRGAAPSFHKIFDWMTIQRKLKDAGRFVYIDHVKKNPSFLKYIPTSLAYVREALQRQGYLKGFFGILKKYVPEFN